MKSIIASGVFSSNSKELRLLESEDVPGKGNGCDLHAQTNAQVRNLMLSGIARRSNHAFNAAAAKAAGNDNAVDIRENFVKIVEIVRNRSI